MINNNNSKVKSWQIEANNPKKIVIIIIKFDFRFNSLSSFVTKGFKCIWAQKDKKHKIKQKNALFCEIISPVSPVLTKAMMKIRVIFYKR